MGIKNIDGNEFLQFCLGSMVDVTGNYWFGNKKSGAEFGAVFNS
jgi:hypothetical protein